MDRNLNPPPDYDYVETQETWRTRSRRRWLPWLLTGAILLTLFSLLAGFWMARASQATPRIEVSPATGSVGAPITVRGMDWPRDKQVTVGLTRPQAPLTEVFVLATIQSQGENWSVTVPIPDASPWRDLPTFNVVAFTPDRDVTASQVFTRQPSTAAGPAPVVTPAVVVVVEPTPAPTPAPAVIVVGPTPAPIIVVAPTAPPPPAIGAIVTGQDNAGRPRRLLGPVTAVDVTNRFVDVGLTSSISIRAYIPVPLPIATSAGQALTLNDIRVGTPVDIQGLDNGRGLIMAERFVVQSQPAVVAAPANIPTVAIPTTFSGWRGEYYANATLNGPPTLVRDDPELNFNWSVQPPAPGLPADNFSVRWTRTVDLPAGNYRFRAVAEGGVRIWLDGWLVLDSWRDTPGTWMGDFLSVQAGPHVIQVEYFDGSGEARLQVTWEAFEGYPQWRGAYYANPNLEGEPTLLRNEPDVSFNWGDGAPAQGLPADGFSARWMRTLPFEGGNYRFRAQTSGGVRLWVDDTLILDDWQAGTASPSRDFQGLTAGPHRVRVEYVNRGGPAALTVSWERLP